MGCGSSKQAVGDPGPAHPPAADDAPKAAGAPGAPTAPALGKAADVTADAPAALGGAGPAQPPPTDDAPKAAGAPGGATAPAPAQAAEVTENGPTAPGDPGQTKAQVAPPEVDKATSPPPQPQPARVVPDTPKDVAEATVDDVFAELVKEGGTEGRSWNHGGNRALMYDAVADVLRVQDPGPGAGGAHKVPQQKKKKKAQGDQFARAGSTAAHKAPKSSRPNLDPAAGKKAEGDQLARPGSAEPPKKAPKTRSRADNRAQGDAKGPGLVKSRSAALQKAPKSRSRADNRAEGGIAIARARSVPADAARPEHRDPLTRTAADLMVAAWRAKPRPAAAPDIAADLKAHADAYASYAREEAGALSQAVAALGELSAKCPHRAGDALLNDDDAPFNLLAAAARAHAPLTRLAEVLVSATRNSAHKASFRSEIKDVPSLIRKGCTAYVDEAREPQWRRVVDVARASIRVASFEDMGKVVEALKKDREGIQVLRVRDKLGGSDDDSLKANAGYRFASVAVRISGHVCEILLEHKGLRKARTQEQHARYLRFREILGSRI